MHPHLYELDAVNLDIQQNHRTAFQDQQRRILRGEHPGRIAAIAMMLRTFVAAMLIAAGERLRHDLAASPEPLLSSGGAGEPADATGVA